LVASFTGVWPNRATFSSTASGTVVEISDRIRDIVALSLTCMAVHRVYTDYRWSRRIPIPHD
jgi:hypothetical protein